MLDFYGKELAVGDKVLYGTVYASIREGVVTKIDEDKHFISVRCTKDRSGTATRTKYYHAVTGEWIDPYYHQAQEAGFYHKITGQLLKGNYYSDRIYPAVRGYDRFNSVSYTNPDFVPEELREYRKSVYKDYVKEIKLQGGSISVLRDSKGIVKL